MQVDPNTGDQVTRTEALEPLLTKGSFAQELWHSGTRLDRTMDQQQK